MGTSATFRWLPSNARVVVLDGFGLMPRGTLSAPMQALSWPVKDPTDILDYVLDLSQALSGDEGDAIATIDVQIAPDGAGDLSLVSSAADGDQAILWLSQGNPGVTYAVSTVLGTNSGRVISRTVLLPVMALSLPMSLPGAIEDQDGEPLTDNFLAPITV